MRQNDTWALTEPDGETVTVSFGAVKEGVQSTRILTEGKKSEGFLILWEQPDRLGIYSYAEG